MFVWIKLFTALDCILDPTVDSVDSTAGSRMRSSILDQVDSDLVLAVDEEVEDTRFFPHHSHPIANLSISFIQPLLGDGIVSISYVLCDHLEFVEILSVVVDGGCSIVHNTVPCHHPCP